MRVVLTAGFDRALHAVALAELARRAGHVVAAVLVVQPLQTRRVRQWLRQRGVRSLFDAARRLLGASGARSPDRRMEQYLREHDIAERSLTRWCRRHDVVLHRVRDLNAPQAVEALREARADGVLYAGGGILRRAFIEAAQGRVLNAHSGPLPAVRGMNACEWSVLLGVAPTVTIHVIDEGIDTGGVLEQIRIQREASDTIENLRGKCVVVGVEGLLRALGALEGPLPARSQAAGRERQCFTLAPVLRELLEERLGRREAS